LASARGTAGAGVMAGAVVAGAAADTATAMADTVTDVADTATAMVDTATGDMAMLAAHVVMPAVA